MPRPGRRPRPGRWSGSARRADGCSTRPATAGTRPSGVFATIAEALAAALAAFATHGPSLQDSEVVAVGHRVVHGGSRFADPALVDDALIEEVRKLVPLAPLHNAANLEGLRVARRLFPDVPQAAVFDTAFHQTMPPVAYTYAVPRTWREEHRIRRYGFHGTSYAFVSREAARLLGRPVDETNLIVLHLGNGASAAAIRGGQSVDTSMGFTPLEGLVMGTRSGDLDPAIHAHLCARARLVDRRRGQRPQPRVGPEGTHRPQRHSRGPGAAHAGRRGCPTCVRRLRLPRSQVRRGLLCRARFRRRGRLHCRSRPVHPRAPGGQSGRPRAARDRDRPGTQCRTAPAARGRSPPTSAACRSS